MPPRTRIERFLPLKPAALHILLALAEAPRHGYAIRGVVETRTDGDVRLWPATLYGTIRELKRGGLIEDAPAAAAPGDDSRRRYYQLTALGRQVLAAETERLRRLVRLAQRTYAASQG
ncbi:MAG TPA: helix-turn-helix transcriptional regulator [Gemmatimonadaceae bacterium]|nr:helix-turn-helix transcriptional regulator [Gemmatimonadaceae bacterium]